MKFHDTLNEKIWNGFELKPEVKEKLREISDAFKEYLDINEDAILDIRITGSSASYNYTKYSDLDLHFIIDYEKVHEDCPLVEGYLWSYKSQFNANHDISIYGVPVEVYAEDSTQEAVSNGVYSLIEDRWLKRPEKIEPTDNDAAVKAKFDELKAAVDNCDDSEVAEELQAKIYTMRKAGLAEEGEFSTENLAFKQLRNAGCLDKLKQLKKEQIDKQLSLESLNKKLSKFNKQLHERKNGQVIQNLSNTYTNKDESLLYNIIINEKEQIAKREFKNMIQTNMEPTSQELLIIDKLCELGNEIEEERIQLDPDVVLSRFCELLGISYDEADNYSWLKDVTNNFKLEGSKMPQLRPNYMRTNPKHGFYQFCIDNYSSKIYSKDLMDNVDEDLATLKSLNKEVKKMSEDKIMGTDFLGPKELKEYPEGTELHIEFNNGPGQVEVLAKTNKNNRFVWKPKNSVDPFVTTDYEYALKLIDRYGGEIVADNAVVKAPELDESVLVKLNKSINEALADTEK